MIRQLLTLVFVLTIFINVSGQTKSYFPYLTRISVDTTYNVFFGYDKSTTRLIKRPCYSLDKTDPFHCNEDEVLATWTILAKFKNKSLKDSIYIVYSEGMSADPVFKISTKPDASTIIGSFYCLEFYINASGTIYTSGHTNNMFNKRRKFQIQNDTIVEVQQPYLYVGMKGKTLKEITLFKDKVGKDIVAQLPKNYEIEILLAETGTKDFEIETMFLVRTDFGLVGWLRLEGFGEQVIKDLYYAGD